MTLGFHPFNTVIISHMLLFLIYIHVFLDASRNKTQRMQKQDKRPKDNDP